MGPTTGMDMLTGNDVSMPGIKPSTPTITTANTTTTNGHWQEGKQASPLRFLGKIRKYDKC
jgi:hypothetical protein